MFSFSIIAQDKINITLIKIFTAAENNIKYVNYKEYQVNSGQL